MTSPVARRRPTSTPRDDDRARERLCRHGPRSLGLADLVAIVLGPGGRNPARHVAWSLLDRYPDARELARLPVDTLRSLPGIGLTRATRFAAARELGRRLERAPATELPLVRGPGDLEPLLRRELGGLDREHVLGLYLDARHRLLAVRTISIGTLDASLVHPREVFRPAVGLQAAAVVVAHNHPSGCAQPSGDDLELTRRLARCGRLLGIELLDHVVVGDAGLVSIREYGWPGDV